MEERTAPTAYGKIDLVCRDCGKTTSMYVDVGPEAWESYRVACECGAEQILRLEVS